MTINSISLAYKEENLIGSYLTAPLRNYTNWFAAKITASTGVCQRLAWKISYVVATIFVYLPLGLLAALGTAINLCLIRPKDDYSLWEKVNGLKRANDEYVNDYFPKIEQIISGFLSNKKQGSQSFTTSFAHDDPRKNKDCILSYQIDLDALLETELNGRGFAQLSEKDTTNLDNQLSQTVKNKFGDILRHATQQASQKVRDFALRTQAKERGGMYLFFVFTFDNPIKLSPEGMQLLKQRVQ